VGHALACPILVSLSRAHALLGRALFVSFLEKRQFIKPDYYLDGTNTLSSISLISRPRVDEIKRLLYQEFFRRLKIEFNGTMFDAAQRVDVSPSAPLFYFNDFAWNWTRGPPVAESAGW
jgi:hypothetical protein